MAKLSVTQLNLLRELRAAWPDPVTIAPESPDLLALRDEDLISQWDSWPDGRRRWMITQAGRAALAKNVEG